jgi:hypothetical protein
LAAATKPAATAQCDDQAADDVESSVEDEREPAPKRWKSSSAKSSAFVGLSWNKRNRNANGRLESNTTARCSRAWATLTTSKRRREPFDTAARRLRGDEAHGGRAGGKNWYRLNFPTEREVKRADARGLLTEEDKAAAAAATSARQGPSAFVGVSWKKDRRKWRAQIKHEGAVQYLGSFNDEREAALAVDTAARRLHGDDAHGGRALRVLGGAGDN